MRPVRAAARALLSGIFLVSGARALSDPRPFVSRARPVTDKVGPLLARANPALPTDTESLVRLNGAVQVVGGLLLSTGHLTRPAAAMLAGSLVPTTLAGHAYWNVQEPAERANHKIHFVKNLGLLGGLLMAAADTGGRPGLRWRAARAVGDGRRSVARTVDHGRRTVRRTARTAQREARIAALRSAAVARRIPG